MRIAAVVKMMQTKKKSRKIGFGTVSADWKDREWEAEGETMLIGGASCSFLSETCCEGDKIELSGIDSRSRAV